MSFLSRLFQSQRPVEVKTIQELYEQVDKFGGSMILVDEYGSMYKVEKVEENNQRPDLTKNGYYELETVQGDGILCLDCKRISYHPKDIEEKYCGNCHKFHPESVNLKG